MIEENKYNLVINLFKKSLIGNLNKEEESLLENLLHDKNLKELYKQISDEDYVMEKIMKYEKYPYHDAYDHFRKSINKTKSVKMLIRISTIAASIVIVIGLAFFLKNIPDDISISESKISSKNIFAGNGIARLITENNREIKLTEDLNLGSIGIKGLELNKDSSILNYSGKVESLGDKNRLVYHELIIPRAGEYKIKLSDGSIVYLNSDTKLKYPVVFNGNKREVFLEGEAYIDVFPNKEKPFIVNCGDFSVKALGTAFNIMNYKDEDFSHTTLIEGKVEVKFGDKKVILKPGLQAFFAGKDVEVRRVNIESYKSWIYDKFSFTDERLDVVLRKIARWYDVEVFYVNPSVKNNHLTGRIKKYNSLKDVFELLEMVANVKCEIKNKNVYVMEK